MPVDKHVDKHDMDWDGVKGQNIFFSLKVVMLHIKFMGMEHRAPCTVIYSVLTHILPSFASAQSYQHLCYLLIEKYHI